MANTYTQIHIYMIFAVKYRDAVISKFYSLYTLNSNQQT
jgi:hypothetical protein